MTDRRMTGSGVIDDVIHEVTNKSQTVLAVQFIIYSFIVADFELHIPGLRALMVSQDQQRQPRVRDRIATLDAECCHGVFRKVSTVKLFSINHLVFCATWYFLEPRRWTPCPTWPRISSTTLRPISASTVAASTSSTCCDWTGRNRRQIWRRFSSIWSAKWRRRHVATDCVCRGKMRRVQEKLLFCLKTSTLKFLLFQNDYTSLYSL